MSELRKKPRYQVSNPNKNISDGTVWVKKANMYLKYTYYNNPKRPDIFNWI